MPSLDASDTLQSFDANSPGVTFAMKIQRNVHRDGWNQEVKRLRDAGELVGRDLNQAIIYLRNAAILKLRAKPP